MSSGALVGIIGDITPPGTSYATFDVRVGGSTPAESVPVYNFDSGAIEYIDFYCRLFGYAGGGLTITFDWSASTATADAVVWGAALRRIEDDAEDVDASQTYDFNDATDTCASASGERSRVSITFTHGADMDSVADGEAFILRIRRNATSGSDTMTGDAQLWAWTLAIVET